MPGIVALVSLISADVVTRLAEANYTPLVDGKILLGRQYQMENSAPPRIIFVPTKNVFSAKDTTSGASFVQGGYSAEQLAQNANPSFMTDALTFEVRCWGTDPDRDPDYDYDFTQALYQQVLRSCDKLARGTFLAVGGEWTDSSYGSGQLVRDGREFVFNLTFGTPVLLNITPLQQAPGNVTIQDADKLTLPTGANSPGCAG